MNSWNDFFSIGTSQIWELWKFSWRLSNPDYSPSPLERKCLLVISRFLLDRDQQKGISEFRQMLGYSDSEGYAIENEIRNMTLKGIYFGNSMRYEVNGEGINEPVGILVNQNQRPDFYNQNEKVHFERLFPFQFIKMESDLRDKFLAFHLNETFKGDRISFSRFLNSMKADHLAIIQTHIEVLNDWIEYELNENSSTEITTIVAAYMVKFIHESELSDKKKIIKNIVEEYPNIKEGSLRTRFFDDINTRTDGTEDNVYHKKHKKEIEKASRILGIKRKKASKIGFNFLNELD